MLRSAARAARPALLPLLFAACGGSGPDVESAELPLMEFDTASVRVATETDTLPLRVELAETQDQRAIGLMERPSLDPDAGMLFVYEEDQPGDAGFWMFRTRVPLDIAFLDAQGRILAVRAMDPCTSPEPRWCVNPAYAPGEPYRFAIEVNQGWFARNGVGPGDRVLLPGAP